MTDEHMMPQYDGMEYEELVTAAQFLWMENAKLHEYVTKLEQAITALDSDNTDLLNDMMDMQMIVADNRKLRKFAAIVWQVLTFNEPMFVWQGMVDDARELGIDIWEDER